MIDKIKLTDIDPALTRTIWQQTGVPSASSEDVLAWLANNPITPSLEQVRHIVGSHMDKWEDIKFSRLAFAQRVADFQRFAYLKPEPVYPSELSVWHNMFMKGEINTTSLMRKAYDLGRVQKMDKEKE